LHDLDPSAIRSSEYRRPTQLKPGPVLVVGASHSGTDIAYEVATTHPTILVGRDPGQMPVRLDHWSVRLILPVFVFLGTHVITRRTPIGRKAMNEIRFHGAPMLRVKRSDLQARGVERILGRVTGVHNGLPAVDGQALDVVNVVWCTGFRQVFDWIDLPVFGADGWPLEMRAWCRLLLIVFLWARFPVRVQPDGAAGGGKGCRLRREADRRAS
jgi:putative flavoprotein involved in K+ transport